MLVNDDRNVAVAMFPVDHVEVEDEDEPQDDDWVQVRSSM